MERLLRSWVTTMRKSLKTLALLAAVGLLYPVPRAHAVSKEIIQLQTQVQALQDAIAHLQQTNDEQLGALMHTMQQTSDNMNKMNQTMTALQNSLQAQEQAGGGQLQQVSTQIQSLNDSVDELRTRIGKLDTEIQAIQSQLQNVNATPNSGAAPAGTPGTGPASPQGAGVPPGPQGQTAQPSAATPPQGAPAPQAMMQQSAPPAGQLYQAALSDYEGGHYALAAGEFADVVKNYPGDELAGNAQFYIGEVAYRQAKYRDAVTAYDKVLEQYAGNPKAPAAQLHKAYAELALNQRDAGIRDLRSLIGRYPQTPEAEQARSRLNGMGVRIVPKPSPYQQ
jgi:tol-pal system protein YbgF